MPTRDDLVEARADGNRIFMVAFELCTLLFALVYAFPHIPTALVDEIGQRQAFNWTSVTGVTGLREAIRGLLRTSDVLESCRRQADGEGELEAVCDPHTLSDFYRLNLDDDAVPLTARQMMESLSRVYHHLFTLELKTREDVLALLRHHQFLATSARLRPGTNADRSRGALLTFCTELSVEWMQPYFARNATFYVPPALARDHFASAADHRRAAARRLAVAAAAQAGSSAR